MSETNALEVLETEVGTYVRTYRHTTSSLSEYLSHACLQEQVVLVCGWCISCVCAVGVCHRPCGDQALQWAQQ